MVDHCPSNFDQELLSGFLDHELRQEDEQLVDLHLEDCEQCRAVFSELQQLREVTMATQFDEPNDRQWNEAATNGAAVTTRGLGWLMAVIWAVVFSVYGLWQLWLQPQSLMLRLFLFGGLSAIALLFVSVVIDRLKTAKDDPYREVQK